jgi:hypothetical protein
LTALTKFSWWSVCTCLRVAMSQMEAVLLLDAETSRDESGEKSTPLTSSSPSCEKTFSYVFASHTTTLPHHVPAVIHLPSLDTARHWTFPVDIDAICLPSSTRHIRTPPASPLTRCSPFAANATADMSLPPLISMRGEPSCPTVSVNATHIPSTHRSLSKTWSSATQL